MEAKTILKIILILCSTIEWYSCSRPRCPTFDDKVAICVCDAGDNFNGWEFTCLTNTFDLLFSIKYIVDIQITFRCGEKAPYTQQLLSQIDLSEVQRFVFKSCGLPNSSFSEILPDQRITELKVEKAIGDSNFTNTIFENISSTVTSLILSNNKIVNLPDDIFSSFTVLNFLSLSDNELKSLSEKLFWTLPNLEVLEIANNKLETLPDNIFRGLFQLEKLYLYKNKLKRLPPVLFQSLVNLKVLDLADNNLIILPDDIFVGLSQLVSLRLRGNWLEILPKELFNYTAGLRDIDLSLNKFMEPLPEELLFGLGSLENVSIHDCNLTHIYEKFFSHCPNITHLKLMNNGLSALSENIFQNNSKLKELNLNFNFISDLPEKLLPNQNYLETLSLFKNNISSIPSKFFRHARNIKLLVLGRNSLVEMTQDVFRDLPNLEKIDLSINKLRKFSLDFNEHIRHIELFDNNLTEMPQINWLQHLKMEVFNIERNQLTKLSIPVLYSTNKRNPELNFGHNNIQTVDVTELNLNDGHIQDLPSKDYENYVESTISLFPNPFVCDCRLYDFYNYLQKINEARKRSVRFSFIQNLTCNSPSHLAKQSILLMYPHQFSCQIKEDCEPPCSCYLRAKDGAIVVDCANQNLQKPPKIAPPNTNILYLQNNSLTSLTDLNDPIWENLTGLFLHKNLITSTIGWNIPPNLVNLTLEDNKLESISPHLLNFTSHSKDSQITLSSNPWKCNCSTMYFKKWMIEHYQIVGDAKNVNCSEPVNYNGTMTNMSVLSIPDDIMCPTDDWPYRSQLIAVTTVCVVLALLLFIVSILYYRNKQTVIAYVYIHLHNVFMCFFNQEDMDEDKIFDAFVSYSSADRDVALKLLDELETKNPNFRLCIHERNWLPGNLISWNIINSVQNSRRTILVVSKEFLESMWFQVEFHTAYYQMLEDKIDRLIVIVKGELPPKNTLDKDLQYLLSTKTYLVWEEKWFWEKLKYAMPHKKQEIVSNDVMALKDRPDSKKVKSVENQIAVLSSNGDKELEKVTVSNGTRRTHGKSMAPTVPINGNNSNTSNSTIY